MKQQTRVPLTTHAGEETYQCQVGWIIKIEELAKPFTPASLSVV
jgi:hypothetical protein